MTPYRHLISASRTSDPGPNPIGMPILPENPMSHHPSIRLEDHQTGSTRMTQVFLDEDLNQDRYEIQFDQRPTW